MLKRAEREEMLKKLMERSKRQGHFEEIMANKDEKVIPPMLRERVADAMADNQSWIDSLYSRLLNDE